MKLHRLPIGALLNGKFASDGAYIDKYINEVSPLFLTKFFRIGINHTTGEIILANKKRTIKEFRELLDTESFKELCNLLFVHNDKVDDISKYYPILEVVFKLHLLDMEDNADIRDTYYVNSIDVLWKEYDKYKKEM